MEEESASRLRPPDRKPPDSQAVLSARQWQAARNGNKRRQWAAMIYPGEGKKGQPKAGDYVLAAEQTRAEAAADPDQTRAFDLARADRWEAQARTKQLPSTRTEIGAGGELIDREDRWDELGVVMSVTIAPSAAPIRPLPYSSTRPIGRASVPSGISPAIPGSSRPTRMPGSTRWTGRIESPG